MSINYLPLHKHEENEELITNKVLEDSGYIINNTNDFNQSKEDYLLGLALIRDRFYRKELENNYILKHEIKTKEEYNIFCAENNIFNFHVSFSKPLFSEAHSYKLYKIKE